MTVCYIQGQVAQDVIKNAASFNKTQEVWLNLIQYHVGDAMEAKAFRVITPMVTLDQRLNWFGILPVLREAGLLFKSEVGACVVLCCIAYDAA